MSSHIDENGHDIPEGLFSQRVEPEVLSVDNAFDSFHDKYWSSQSTVAIPMLDETEGSDRFSCVKYPDRHYNGFLPDSSPVSGGSWSTFSKRSRSSSLNGILHQHEKRHKDGLS